MRFINWLIFDFLINTGVWLICCLIGITIFSIKTYRRSWINSNVNVFAWGVLTFTTIVVVSVVYIITSNFIANNWRRGPSRVDISPIATINENYFARIDDAMLHLANYGYVRIPIIREPLPSQNPRYLTQWISRSRFSSNTSRLTIEINHCVSEEYAISWLLSSGRHNPKHVYAQNDNNTDILSVYPWMPVSAGGWNIPSELRSFRTEIRLGNVVIVLREERPWHDIRNEYSSQFIIALINAINHV